MSPIKRDNSRVITETNLIRAADLIRAVRLFFFHLLRMENSSVTPSTRLRRAITRNEIEPKLRQVGMSDRDIRYLFDNTEFLQLLYRNHQLHFFKNFYFDNYKKYCSSNQLAFLFEMNPRTVRKNLASEPQDPKDPGRHHALSDEIEMEIIQEIENRFKEGNPITQAQILEYVKNRYNICLTFGWVNCFLCRHKEKLQKCRSYPQEDLRMMIPRQYLEKHIQNLKDFVQGICSELLFNLDEVGLSDYEDRKIKKVIAPKYANRNRIQHKVSRKLQHMTMLACVSSAGDALTPMLIMKNSIPDELEETGIRIGEDVILKQRQKPYMDEQLFFEYITTVLIPYIDKLRENEMYSNEKALIMMDSASCHCSSRILQLLAKKNILVLVYPSHTSNLFQALDLCFFGAMKKNKSNEMEVFSEKILINTILEVLQAYEKTATTQTIRNSFRLAGIKSTVGQMPKRVIIDEVLIRNNPGFQEIWNLNIPIEAISQRRQKQQFGIINMEYIQQNKSTND